MLAVLRNISGRRSKQLIIVTVFMAVAFIVIRFIPDLNGSQNQYVANAPKGVAGVQDEGDADGRHSFVVIESANLEAVPAWLTRESKCPACFGIDVCKDVRHKLQIQLPENLESIGKQRFYALWEKQLVVVRTLVSNETFQKYDKFLCSNVSGGQTDSCDIASSVIKPNSPAIKQDSFLPHNLQSAWKIAYSSPDSLPFTLCASKDLIKHVTTTVDPDRDNALTIDQVAMMYTSMVLNQEAMLLRFFNSLEMRLPVPRMLGACGRVVVVEDYGKSLLSYLESPWHLRAELGLQILEVIDSFVNTDPRWAFLFRNLHLRSFSVIEDRELLAVNLDNVIIIDKQWMKTLSAGQDLDEDYVCNVECFEKFSQSIRQDQGSPDHQARCAQAPPIGKHQMLHQVCKVVFSDREEDRQSRVDYLDRPGLLHDPPTEVSEHLTDVLQECIEESQVGGRRRAVTQLKEVLQKYANYSN